MDTYSILSKSLISFDRDRDRSKQKEIGASSIGGCKRQAWHIINQTKKTNDDIESLSAILGTAIHAHIAEALKTFDPFEEEFLIEYAVKNDELKGNVDLYIRSEKKVVDWKTITLAKKSSFPTKQQKMQVNLYAKLLIDNGYEVEKVSLCGIPRDGKMADTIVWEKNYDPELAEAGLQWLRDVKNMIVPPDPERAYIYCRSYCEYFDPTGEVGCPSK